MSSVIGDLGVTIVILIGAWIAVSRLYKRGFAAGVEWERVRRVDQKKRLREVLNRVRDRKEAP